MKQMEATDPGILIVDDNDDNRYTLQLLLETDGHQRIVSAAGGKDALALLEKGKFNLVLLDMMMPDLNGDEVLKIIKDNPDTRDIPVVMISADSDTEKVSRCIALGADDYLPKPSSQTKSGHQAHPGHCADCARHVGLAREGARGRMRRVRHQTDRFRPPAAQDQHRARR